MDHLSAISALLRQASIDGEVLSLTPLATGGNNRTYRLATSAGDYLVKEYFRHAADERDRLGGEHAFLSYAGRVAAGWVPGILAVDRQNGVALHEFIEGKGFAPGDIGDREVDAAIAFFRALNGPDRSALGQGLPVASEACFSLSGHLERVAARLASLADIPPASREDDLARGLVTRMRERHRQLSAELAEAAAALGLDPAEALPAEQRCISPSDFGFHNALALPEGGLRFIDFEYGGWDDPGKMIGDFFAQLAVPVPAGCFARFAAECTAGFTRSEELRWRASLLRPVYQLKWCCIALNVFLPVHLARRKFANPGLDEAALKAAQLAKAEKLFSSLYPVNHGLH